MRSKADNEIILNQAETINILKNKIVKEEARRIMSKRMEDISAGIVNNSIPYVNKHEIKKESTMIPFNSERADAGDKVIDKFGTEVTQLKVFIINNSPYLYGVMHETITFFYYRNLFMAPKPLSGFVNVYEVAQPSFFIERSRADIFDEGRVACIDLSQHEEGQGL